MGWWPVLAPAIVAAAALAVVAFRRRQRLVVVLHSDELRVVLSSFGASILDCEWRGIPLTVHDRSWNNPFYMGCVVGRVAGRIRNGQFSLQGVDYTVEANSGPHVLHGGRRGWSHVNWTLAARDARSATWLLTHPDDGFPGRVVARVVYALDASTLTMRFECAATDGPSPVSMTNHAYWNLNGVPSSVANHRLKVDNSSRLVVLDDDLLPTGELASRAPFAKATALDQPWDNTLVADDGCQLKARLVGDRASIRLETSQPGLHVYTANFLPKPHTAVCLETQHLPDSPNHPAFPQGAIVTPAAPYIHVTRLTFEDPTETLGKH